MKKLIAPLIFVILCISTVEIQGQAVIKNDSIRPYIHFLENNQFLSAKEYILSKFETYDIIVLSERDHRDMTQYEVILDVVKDERFKGNIYTEVGVFNMTDRINNFLLNSTFTEEEKERELLSIERDLDFFVIWDKYNYYHLLSEVYEINKNRKTEDKILIFPTDVAFDWNNFTTSEAYNLFLDLLENRRNGIDRNVIMGQNFVDSYEETKYKNPNKTKALVIQNTYHGYTRKPPYYIPTEPLIYSTGEYIYKTYPDKTFGIYINYLRTTGGWTLLSNNGIIDAAFEYTKKDNIGFDLKDTPIGNSKFDLYWFGWGHNVNFDYIFDGMIFYRPLKEIILKQGIPNVYPKEYEEQFFRRMAIINNQTLEEAMNDKENIDFLKEINNPIEGSLDEEELETVNRQIKRWIE